MATFNLGNTGNNGNTQTFSADRCYVSPTGASPKNGTPYEGRGRVWVSAAASPGCKMVLYRASDGVKIAESDSVTINNTTEAEKVFPFSGANLAAAIVAGVSYKLGYVFDDPGTPNFTMSRANTASQTEFMAATFPTVPDPFVSGGSANGPLDCYLICNEVASAKDQSGFRFREDDGDEDGATWAASENTNLTRKVEIPTRLRMQIDAEGDPDALLPQLEYQEDGADEWKKILPRLHLQGWFFPTGSDDFDTADAYSDGRHIDVLKPEYYALVNSGMDIGTLVLDDIARSGNYAYSSDNAAHVLANCEEAFFTVSGHKNGLVSMIGDAGNGIDSTKRANFISTLVSFCTSIGFHGVDIDIEGYGDWDATTTSRFVTLMDDLADALHVAGKKLSVCLPAISDSTYQSFFELTYESFNSTSVDYFVIMAYDYQWDYGAQNPLTPTSWLEDICDWALDKFSDDSKIVIGLPAFGFYGTNAPDSYDIVAVQFKEEMAARTGYGTATRDANSFEMKWVNSGLINWYCDEVTIRKKTEVVAAKGIHKVSIWSIGGGNDWNRQEFVLNLSSNFTDNTTTTYQLTPPTGKTSADFLAGSLNEASNPAASINLGTDEYTEVEWSIIATTDAVEEAIYNFRVTNAGALLDTYTQNPEWEIEKTPVEQSATHTADGLVRASLTATHTTDAFVYELEDETATHTLDALVGAIATGTHTLDSFVSQLLTAGHNVDALISKIENASHALDGLVREMLTASHTINGLVRQSLSAVHTFDAYVSAGDEVAHTTDALVSEILTLPHTLDALVHELLSATQSADGLVNAPATTSHTADALVIEERTASHSVNAYVFTNNMAAASVDGLVKALQSAVHTTDGLISEILSATQSADALVSKSEVAVQTVNALVSARTTLTHALDGLISVRESASHSTDALIKAQGASNALVDALVAVREQITHSADAFVILSQNLAHSADALVSERLNATHSLDGSVRVPIDTATHTLDAEVSVGVTYPYRKRAYPYRDVLPPINQI